MIATAIIGKILLKQWKLIALGLALVALFTMGKMYLKERQEKLRHESNYKAQAAGKQQWKDKYDREHTKVWNLTLKRDEIVRTKDSIIAKVLTDYQITKRDLKKINNLLYIERALKDTLVLCLYDTIVKEVSGEISYIKMTSFNDGFLSLTALVYPDSIRAQYQYRDEFLITIQWERNPDAWKPWRILGFARKIYSTEVVSSNPKSTTIKIKSLTIKKKKRNQ